MSAIAQETNVVLVNRTAEGVPGVIYDNEYLVERYPSHTAIHYELPGVSLTEYKFITCDDQWAYAYCSFADSPFPRVIYSYDPTRGMYLLDTPRFASRSARDPAR